MQKQNTLPAPSVLIETLWNVNRRDFDGHGEMTNGFNRNIVECKYLKGELKDLQDTGFNRNIVECKSKDEIHAVVNFTGFNRNIVECK